MAREAPAYLDAKRDRALRGNPFLVYLWCDEHLDYLEYRFVKHSALAFDLEISNPSVSRAIATLIARGYIAVGQRDGRLASYRLYHSRETAAAIRAQMKPVSMSA